MKRVRQVNRLISSWSLLHSIHISKSVFFYTWLTCLYCWFICLIWLSLTKSYALIEFSIFAGVTDIEQKKDETEKTEAETEKKTTDSKCFFVNFGLFIHFLYSNQSRRQFVYSANQNLTDVPRLPWPAAVTYCFFQVSFTSLLCGRNYWTCNTNPRALLHLKAEIWTYKHFPGLVLYSVGHQKSNRVHIFHISRIQAPVVDESSTQSLVITNSFRELIVWARNSANLTTFAVFSDLP